MKKLIILFIAALLSAGAYAADTASDSPPLTKKEQRRTLRGFRTYVDAGYIFRLKKYKTVSFLWVRNTYKISSNLFTNVTVGYQINNFFFLGAGAGLAYLVNADRLNVPVYGDVRLNILNKKYSPFLDVKLGKSFGMQDDLYYASLSVGIRFLLKKKTALNFGIETSAIASFWGSECDDSSGIGLKVGFEI